GGCGPAARRRAPLSRPAGAASGWPAPPPRTDWLLARAPAGLRLRWLSVSAGKGFGQPSYSLDLGGLRSSIQQDGADHSLLWETWRQKCRCSAIAFLPGRLKPQRRVGRARWQSTAICRVPVAGRAIRLMCYVAGLALALGTA